LVGGKSRSERESAEAEVREKEVTGVESDDESEKSACAACHEAATHTTRGAIQRGSTETRHEVWE